MNEFVNDTARFKNGVVNALFPSVSEWARAGDDVSVLDWVVASSVSVGSPKARVLAGRCSLLFCVDHRISSDM